ncbi:choline transporter-like 1 [Macrosteles quadrilineatus]|uniref:choline transporter-like 1 n=1 Tax=Macrosteles quadrilineatus TaxID=74068 RepID=UPI0023E281CA|nr:choline transporter-like 1 [Macrosteles quadrilineatus]XP_054274773.1 choline transporter-like 1 [Macrosteles quadrilineatus]XP_054289431.1 choline transporter-like 1 [Macrosteles quadrilineatus]XP_054289432.1 choline transporter-like 1 [Macrosteles quadrilineatus]
MACCDDTGSEDENQESVKIRGCTDVFWLIIYILFWFLMILIAGFALVYGNPLRLIHGYDSFGNTCGSSYNDDILINQNLSGINTLDRRYLFFTDIRNIRNSLQLCVKKCPDRNIDSIQELQQFYKDTGSSLCRYDFDLENYKGAPHNLSETATVLSSLGPCPPLPVYKSVPILNRCVPEPVTDIVRTFVRDIYGLLNSWDFGEQILSDIFSAWEYIAGLTFLSLVLSLLMVSLFYLVASFVAHIILVAVSLVCIGATGYLWVTFYQLKSQLDSTSSDQLLDEAVQNERAFCIYSIIATIVTVIILLLVLVMRSRVDFVATLFKEAADCLAALPSLYLQPVVSFVQLIIFYAFWLLVVVCLATANYPGAKPLRPFSSDSVLETLQFAVNKSVDSNKNLMELKNISAASFTPFTLVDYTDGTWVRYVWWVYFIGLVWTSEFILACQQMVIAGAVARWYFNKDKTDPKPPVWTAYRHLISYHLGSMALGSLLITLFKVPRLILSYISAKLKKNEQSEVAQCLAKCCTCCLYVFENCIRYINHNAYTVVAMQGINFCPAASRAWHVLVNNSLRLATLNSVGDFILFLGKLIVMCITGVIGLFIFKQDPDLHLYAAPTLVVCIFAYFVAHCVISLYEVVIDTLFLCVCEDQNIHGDEGRWRQTAIANLSAARKAANLGEQQPINT